MNTQEAIKYIEEHGYVSDEFKDMAINALENQLPKKVDSGVWQPIWLTSYPPQTEYQCSECHVLEKITSRYCPNCGAKMKDRLE